MHAGAFPPQHGLTQYCVAPQVCEPQLDGPPPDPTLAPPDPTLAPPDPALAPAEPVLAPPDPAPAPPAPACAPPAPPPPVVSAAPLVLEVPQPAHRMPMRAKVKVRTMRRPEHNPYRDSSAAKCSVFGLAGAVPAACATSQTALVCQSLTPLSCWKSPALARSLIACDTI